MCHVKISFQFAWLLQLASLQRERQHLQRRDEFPRAVRLSARIRASISEHREPLPLAYCLWHSCHWHCHDGLATTGSSTSSGVVVILSACQPDSTTKDTSLFSSSLSFSSLPSSSLLSFFLFFLLFLFFFLFFLRRKKFHRRHTSRK